MTVSLSSRTAVYLPNLIMYWPVVVLLRTDQEPFQLVNISVSNHSFELINQALRYLTVHVITLFAGYSTSGAGTFSYLIRADANYSYLI